MNVLTFESSDFPALDMMLTGVLLEAVRDRLSSDCIRVFRPGATVAFGRRDRLEAGFGAACRLTHDRNHTPVVRLGGGRAVAYNRNCLLVELIRQQDRTVRDFTGLSSELATLIQTALASLGTDLVLGEQRGEYCPGPFSLRLPDGPKVAGIAQKIVHGASLTTAALAVDGSELLRTLTTDVYAELDLPLAPTSVGALSDQYPGAEPVQVMSAIMDQALMRYGGARSPVPPAVVDEAQRRVEMQPELSGEDNRGEVTARRPKRFQEAPTTTAASTVHGVDPLAEDAL